MKHEDLNSTALEIEMPKYFEMEVSLVGVKPRIWRRFLIARDASFRDLHNAIQDACGWEDDHLYDFRNKSGKPFAKAVFKDAFPEMGVYDADTMKLLAYFSKNIDVCTYVYDFGDYWQHRVGLKGIVELPEKFKQRLLGGARAFPLENCGGIWGYHACCAAVGAIDPKDMELGEEELEHYREWVGDGYWQPDSFDLEETKKRFDC